MERKKIGNKIYFIFLLIAGVTFLFLLTHSHARGLNQDDIASIHVYAGQRGFVELLHRNIEMGLQPPIPAIVFYAWSQLAPATVDFVKMPSMIAISLSVFAIGCLGKDIKDNKTGIIAAILLAGSYYSFVECAFSARGYGLLPLMAIGVYKAHNTIRKQSEEKNILLASVVAYSIMLAALMYTHYFGTILAFSLGVVDLIWIILKRKQLEFKRTFVFLLGAYVVAVCLFIPWGMVMLGEYGETHIIWTERPGLSGFFIMLYYYFSDKIAFLTVSVACVVAAVLLLKNKQKSHWTSILLSYAGVVFVGIAIPLIYSGYLRPDNSVWVRRYFCGLMPAVYLIVALLLSFLIDNWGKVGFALAMAVLVVTVCLNVGRIPWNTQDNRDEVYAGSIEYLDQINVEKDASAVILSSWFGDAFNYFYTDNFRNDRTPALTALEGTDIPDNIDTVYIVTSFVGDWETFITDKDFEWVPTKDDLQIEIYRRVK